MATDKNTEQFIKSLQKYAEDLYGPCDQSSECESPIESMLYQAISIVAAQRAVILSVSTQHKINAYRVDFLISGSQCCGSCTTRFSKEVIVECDGHDFHEKTKEQASRDKRRDRILQQLGYNVFRFSGSDIWKDVFDCALEIVEFLDRAIEGQSIDHWQKEHPVNG